MMKVITTVGTSLFTNYLKREICDLFGDEYRKIEDELKRFENLNSKSLEEIEYTRFKEQIEDVIKNKWLKGLKYTGNWSINEGEINFNASAEISSLIKIKEEMNQDIEVYLVASDSALSLLAAQIIKENYSINGINIKEIKVVDNLNIKSNDVMIDGFNSLIKVIYNFIRKRGNNDKDEDGWCFNITGGYKGVIPLLTILAQVKNIDLFYIFEESEQLIRIPQFPIQFDWAVAEKYYTSLGDRNLWTGDVKEDLKNLGLINVTQKPGEKEVKTITALGELFKEIIEDNFPEAKNIFGHIIELKLYEYFTNNIYEGYSFVQHSNEELNEGIAHKQKGGEIDILIMDNKLLRDSKKIIIVEIKSLLSFKGEYFTKTKLQLEAKLNILIGENIKPTEVHYVIYTTNMQLFHQVKPIKDQITEIENLVKNYDPEIKSKFFILYANLKLKRNHNPYSYFIQNPIKKNIFKEII